jgi:2-polyprenyl-6-methoxyphenol hydroxylase-like FAD-dependent oxidoreductase
MSDETYDLIVVGARMAGAATAALVARQGARVLLVEQAVLPAPTVSCPIIFGNSLRVLDRIGALAAVEALGAPQIRYYGTRTPDFDLVARLPSSHGRDYAYAIRRELLDAAVLDCVRQQPGVEVREGFAVGDLIWSLGQVVGVRGRAGHGPEETIYARAVVGADGKRSRVARSAGAQDYDRLAGQTCAFYAYYRGFEPLHEPSAVIYANPADRTGALVFDADSGLTAVSVGLPAERFAEARKEPEQALEAAWRELPELAERGRRATRATPVMGQGPVDGFYRQSYGPGWALVGDAGHYIDPITGQGINNALRGAELFAEAWARARGRSSWARAMAEYQRQRDEATRPIYNLLRFSGRLQSIAESGIDLGTPLMQAIARQPAVASRYIGIYSGATRVDQFFNPLHLAQLMVADGLRHQLPRLAASAFAR